MYTQLAVMYVSKLSVCWRSPVGVDVAESLDLNLPPELLMWAYACCQLGGGWVVEVCQHTLTRTNSLCGYMLGGGAQRMCVVAVAVQTCEVLGYSGRFDRMRNVVAAVA
jgi:hypothetical protein